MHKKLIFTVLSLFLLLLIATPVNANDVQITEEDGYIVATGGGYVNRSLTRGTAANPTTTWGNGQFWVSWPTPSRLQANHRNSNRPHATTACNASNCLRNPVNGWRAASASGQARAEVIASGHGNRAYWSVQCPANTPAGDAC